MCLSFSIIYTSLIELEIRDLIGQERDEEIVKPDDVSFSQCFKIINGPYNLTAIL